MIAVPISVLTALFITRVAPKSLRTPLFVIVALLAAVPSVIYGAFGGQWINSLVYSITGVANGPLLSLIFTLALMIMPTITLLTVAAINNVDKKMENSSLALGATRAQTNFKVTLVAAIPGILVGTLLGIGRALGEATAVSMVASQASYGPTFLPTEYTRLITSTMLKGFKELEIGSDEYLYRFALGLLLVTTTFAIFALLKYVQRKQDPENKSMQLTASAVKTRTIAMKYEQRGLEGLSINEQHE
ncbi:MAG: hypothetical protein DRQ78_01305 [Epsilonproteobacteria bacterium]|nr:MAG: hypothetical protein DRQ78_01305 [Campylobacterota bacterium]